ncbi:hypothetical protein B4U79_16381, partial [Dinothrombium tinctorium]
TRCGCAPDAVVKTKYDTKAFIFNNEHFWLYDIFEDSDSVKRSGSYIVDVWPGLQPNFDFGFSAFKNMFFVKGENFWVFNENHRKLSDGNTSSWLNYESNSNAALVSYENHTHAFLEIFTEKNTVQNCLIDRNYSMFCYDTRELTDEEASLAPLQAATTLKSGIQLIFGLKEHCIILPGAPCLRLCNPKIFDCQISDLSLLVIMVIAFLMSFGCLFCVIFYYNLASSNLTAQTL